MSTKKRFSISPDLANGIRSTIQSAASNQGQLHYDMMAIDMIEPDPENPRKLSISREELFNGLNQADAQYQVKIKELDALNELAESIKRVGIRNAIEVYKEGPKYRIVSGERRYLAALLTGQKAVPVRINQKPEEFNLRYTQWVENVNRQDLSLWEKFNNLLAMADAYQKTHQDDFNERILQNLLGVSTIQAYRYFCLLKADEKIIQLIESGKLNNLKLVQELVTMKDKGARNQIISWIQSSKEEITSLTHYREVAGKKPIVPKSQTSGAVNLGKISNVSVAKQLLEILLSDSRLVKYRHGFKNIDWASSKSVKKAFKDLFKTIEKEFSVEECV
ncbi:ParB/RepB/Spo0J family partition protein [Aquicella lusitana]|uniref:ParB/RepB/Spo0J family partition protein n=1 Tax=Aquicella lusitana TaxID=254246 RepID=A0A370G3T7_9COXI|nr:ParB/RepB/Spo0J family partition protein [Aquicella lusitana]RDI38521.1 ParB/RepB/Spo0J family partition protein [Aquicella lusitana]VVC74541.1 putative chromosome-partitioning protein ParB [Aquicella lusitana]